MDDLKFRVWLGKRFWFFDLSTGFNNENKDVSSKPEQFTGLKDRSGNLIFVGDKLWTGDTLLGDVIFSDGSFRIFDPISNDVDSPICWDRTRRLEIIGNIHEGEK
ncbi:MAG: YopX family protein [Promethearchaeota archaeon]